MFKKELPYSVEIEIIKFQESNGKDKTRITADIIVERESQKGIVIGKGGSMLKLLGTNARLSIEEFLGEKIYLELFVKVKEGWKSNESRLKGFGY